MAERKNIYGGAILRGLLVLTLAACADFPALKAKVAPEVMAAPYPQLLANADLQQAMGAAGVQDPSANLAWRAQMLKRRAQMQQSAP